jgi:hypothetical protein
MRWRLSVGRSRNCYEIAQYIYLAQYYRKHSKPLVTFLQEFHNICVVVSVSIGSKY